jgi:multidrug efflux pump subunit AcrB
MTNYVFACTSQHYPTRQIAEIILQFNSFRRTLLTFITIPLILVGIPFGLLATGQPLSFFGTLGIISLAGIIINNAIVLIDQIDIERSRLATREAIVAASQKRLRPILPTSATTVLGPAPMAIAGGADRYYVGRNSVG